VSWTKDSILIRWNINEHQRPFVTGYKIEYQAIGSNVKEQLPLDPSQSEWNIRNLHENTNYDVCMHVQTNLSSVNPAECIAGTTATDSLSVALGSTFGAFLALGIIVMFVFLAKWQHQRRLKRHLQQMSVEDSFDSVAAMTPRDIEPADIELSDVSLEGGAASSSQPSSSGSVPACNGAARRQSHHQADPPSPSDSLLKPPLPLGVLPVAPPDVRPKQPDVRPKDVRPKDKALMERVYRDDDDEDGGGMRPNMSCNW
jgi:hypothetical protein